MRNKIVELALSQIGVKEIPQNEVKYNEWYYGRKVNGSQYAWCAVFISWLANECGIMNDLIPSFSGCGTGVKWFQKRNQWLNGGGTPRKGDIIFFKPTIAGAISSHVGIVVDVAGGNVITVEGNKSNQVKKCEYSLGFNQILGYGLPNYGDEEPGKIEVDLIYQSYDNVKKKWLNEIVAGKGSGVMSYAGNFGHSMGGIRARLTDGSIVYITSHTLNYGWNSEIKKWDNTSMGYSGIKGKATDAVMIKCDKHKVEYRVRLRDSKRWLNWITGYNKKDSRYGYAGNIGQAIDAIEIRLI
jgi:hypothetical protein